jgi:hypothetical protein
MRQRHPSGYFQGLASSVQILQDDQGSGNIGLSSGCGYWRLVHR